MSLEENKEIVRKLWDAINRQDVATIETIYAPELAAALNVHLVIQRLNATFGGWHYDITDLIAEGDKVWCRLITRGRHIGELEGIPPTGKEWEQTGVEFFRIVGGKIVENEWLYDVYHQLKQLGATVVLKHVPETT